MSAGDGQSRGSFFFNIFDSSLHKTVCIITPMQNIHAHGASNSRTGTISRVQFQNELCSEKGWACNTCGETVEHKNERCAVRHTMSIGYSSSATSWECPFRGPRKSWCPNHFNFGIKENKQHNNNNKNKNNKTNNTNVFSQWLATPRQGIVQ